MSEYDVYEPKNKLPDLIKQVQQGERITITNRGLLVADLVPSASGAEQQTRAAIKAIKAMRMDMICQPGFEEMCQQGRK